MLSRFRRNQEGAALVEAALVLPVLVLLVLAVVEASLYFWHLNLAGKAVQLGARKAIVSDAVAVGPGLSPAESASYWNGRVPGARCSATPAAAEPCPQFAVRCDVVDGCRCLSGACRFVLAPAKLTPILSAMQGVLPDLRPENVQIEYATNEFGYVGRPPPIPVDVTVRIIGLVHQPAILNNLVPAGLPIVSSARLPGEDLITN